MQPFIPIFLGHYFARKSLVFPNFNSYSNENKIFIFTLSRFSSDCFFKFSKSFSLEEIPLELKLVQVKNSQAQFQLTGTCFGYLNTNSISG